MLVVGHSSKCIRDLTVCGIFLQTFALLSMLAALAASRRHIYNGKVVGKQVALT